MCVCVCVCDNDDDVECAHMCEKCMSYAVSEGLQAVTTAGAICGGAICARALCGGAICAGAICAGICTCPPALEVPRGIEDGEASACLAVMEQVECDGAQEDPGGGGGDGAREEPRGVGWDGDQEEPRGVGWDGARFWTVLDIGLPWG